LIDHYDPHILTAQDYYPFGMLSRVSLPNNEQTYRFGFNGKENDNDVKGLGNNLDFGARIYDPRIGRFLSTDPIYSSLSESPYSFGGNSPIQNVDIEGEFKLSEQTKALLLKSYPRAYKLLTSPNGIIKLASNKRLVSILGEMGMTEENILSDFTNGSGPYIEVSFSTDFRGRTPKENDGEKILIASRVLDVLEKAETDEDLEAALVQVIEILVHEEGHRSSYLFGRKDLAKDQFSKKWNQPNNFTGSEDGDYVAEKMYGPMVNGIDYKIPLYEPNYNTRILKGAKEIAKDKKNRGEGGDLLVVPDLSSKLRPNLSLSHHQVQIIVPNLNLLQIK